MEIHLARYNLSCSPRYTLLVARYNLRKCQSEVHLAKYNCKKVNINSNLLEMTKKQNKKRSQVFLPIQGTPC